MDKMGEYVCLKSALEKSETSLIVPSSDLPIFGKVAKQNGYQGKQRVFTLPYNPTTIRAIYHWVKGDRNNMGNFYNTGSLFTALEAAVELGHKDLEVQLSQYIANRVKKCKTSNDVKTMFEEQESPFF